MEGGHLVSERNHRTTIPWIRAVTVFALILGSSNPVVAQEEPEPSRDTPRERPAPEPDKDAPAKLDPGFWLRVEIGFADISTTLQLPAGSGGVGGADETSSTFYSPALGIRVGYAPDSSVAVGGALDLMLMRFKQETGNIEQKFDATFGLIGAGAQLYPFDKLGLNIGAVGGYSWLAYDDGNQSGTLWGPGFALSLGLDDRIFRGRTWTGNEAKVARSQLYGAALRFDYAPKVTGGDLEARLSSLALLITGTI
jgi:hypothetical protein